MLWATLLSEAEKSSGLCWHREREEMTKKNELRPPINYIPTAIS
jgi:hypothetical protein